MSKFLPRKLWYHTRDLKQEWIRQDQILELADCLVILGEPGMGKTSLLNDLAATPGAASCTARQLINRPDPRSLLGDMRLLVIDALDEVASATEGDAVDSVLQKLGLLGFPRFVLSCRVADWRAATAIEAIREQYNAPPLELHLEPLDREQQCALLTSLTNDPTRADSLLSHFERFQLDFLGNPQTLKLIASLPADKPLPETSSKLFELATEQLRREHKDGKPELPPDRALSAAGAAFSGLLLTGSSRIVRKASANVGEGEIAFNEIEALAGPDLEQVIKTRLFAGSTDSFTYEHRRIGEYLSARWLAKRADTRAKRKRLLAMLRSEGRVPASLRGLHAWLALDGHFAAEVIKADPMGVIEYSDGEVLTVEQAKLLLDTLEQLSRDNPRFLGWGDYRASSLVVSPLQDEVCAVIADRSREFSFRKLLLDQLQGEGLVQQMREILITLFRDPNEYYAIRERAAQLLIEAGGLDWPEELEAVRCQADRMSTRLAFELMDDIGLQAFSDTQVVETVLAYDGMTLCPIPECEPDRSVARYWKIARQINPERLDGLLDMFADYTKALLPRHAGIDENDLFDLYYELVVMRLAHDAPEPSRLWNWLEHFDEQSTYRRDRATQLAEWFQTNDAMRRAIQQLHLLPEHDPKRFRMRAFNLGDVSPGLSISQADAVDLLGRLDPSDRNDERWREVLWFVRTAGDEGRAVREAAKPFAAHRADLMEWIDGLAEPQEPKWKRKQEEATRKRKAERAVAHAKHRLGFIENLDAMRRGGFRYVIGPARAYLSQFRDIGDDIPAHERVADWVGADVAEAAHEGFEAFLQAKPPYPSAARIAISQAKGTHWHAADIIVAALAERFRTRETPFDGVSTERLMAGLFEIWRSRIDDHAKIIGLQKAIETELQVRDAFECAARLYVEPQLKKRKTHVDHLYALMRSDEYIREQSLSLAVDWLHRYPNLPHEPESELLDAVLAAGKGRLLAPLVAGRLAGPLEDERRRNWDAVQVLVDFDNARNRLKRYSIEPALLWHLRARGGARRRDDRGSASLSPAQIEWIVTSFRTTFPNQGHPSGVMTGDTNPWDASEYLRGLVARLGNDVSDDAIAAMDRLRDASVDGYTNAFKVYAAEQRQARAEQHYIPPTLGQLRNVIEAGPPTTGSDLQAVLLDALDEAQARVKGDPLDWYRNFFHAGGKRKDEEPCRDALLQMLDGRLAGIALRPEDHAADDKRVDIVAEIPPSVIVPIEIKGQWNREIWTAADAQLDQLYVNDRRAERGIYLVLWFGGDETLRLPPKGMQKPTTPEELKQALETTSKAVGSGRVAVFILDLTRPQAL